MEIISDKTISCYMANQISLLKQNIEGYQKDKRELGITNFEKYIEKYPYSPFFSSNAIYFLRNKDKIRYTNLINVYNRILGYYEEIYEASLIDSFIDQFE
jgi:hypothetical protein